jgi:hypothetical protein
MKQLSNSNLAPPGGWRYVDPDTGFKFRRLYRSLEELTNHVMSYREHNNLSKIPHLSAVIEDWLCAQPNMEKYCREAPVASRSLAQYLQGAKSAARILMQGDRAFVAEEIAEARAKLCVLCRHNKNNEKDSRLERYTNTYVEGIVGDRITSVDDKLFSCEICSCALRPKVHISQKIVEDSLSQKERKLLSMGLWNVQGKLFDCWQVKPVLAVIGGDADA